ncbi:MAG: amino acid transporter [Gemmatimonadota bacterium]
MAASHDARTGSDFVRALTLTDATMLVAGSMIGSGIFIVSADIARTVGSPLWLLLTWIATGVVTVLGALAYGELAAMFPRAGGQYVFLRESMGPLMGFLYGWTLFLVIQTGTAAAVAVAFGRFLGVLFPSIGAEQFAWFPHGEICVAALGCDAPGKAFEVGLSPQRVAALASVWVLTAINLRGVREGKALQTTLTVVKTAALAFIVIVGLSFGRSAEAVAANFGGNFTGTPPAGSALVLAFGAAMVGSLFSSDAWNNVTFAASEVQHPQRNLPLALLLGTGMVSVLYIMSNVAYLNVLPLAGDPTGATAVARGIQHATQDRVATAMMETVFGTGGTTLMAIAILISTFGCNNGLILAGARVCWAMARDGVFFARAGRLNSRGVPGFALVVQSLWISALCLTGTYGQLVDYVIFAALVFYCLTTIGLFILRRTRPGTPRPYRAIGYPVLPGLYVVLAGALAVILLLADKTRAQAMAGLAIVLLGIPVFYLWRAWRGAPLAGG